MKDNYINEDRYIIAKKKVKKIKDFYSHLMSYVIINICLSITIVFGLMKNNENTLTEALGNFGVYAVWFSWGIGLFFHWLAVFEFGNLFSKEWEEEKIQELMRTEREKKGRIIND